ncbi:MULTISPECIES: hypothetical protein [unclassified Microcystis]|uniref:hypothetical protein n=2 Tax=unclassified Microcystis TaxID=2643300 RepID=UPI00258C534F|nr:MULTISPECIES: hypothetical protein [unclassified Microcystis]MCA2610251.1 hypothetical protein [Microcystis sp. M27BS1]MCA2637827.1 hypothetical protein [Microcystis sp. M18BS1]MCA2531424.1 hypothetical protein [Microcystis sp. M51BS1]MCA2575460.1 hypothetical protein [Microcystis sp. M41BS1]MCA2585888.1 hypothetical protein [Microcystis sp. M34BS1]
MYPITAMTREIRIVGMGFLIDQLEILKAIISVISYQLSVFSYQLSVISYQLSVFSFQFLERRLG